MYPSIHHGFVINDLILLNCILCMIFFCFNIFSESVVRGKKRKHEEEGDGE